jgi:transcriptional regulator of acetoin/glycerol metabolism
MDHDWPGNVRELENAIEHAFVLCKSDRLEFKDLPIEIRQINRNQSISKPNTSAKPRNENRLDRESLLQLLEDCDWNKAEVGRRAGVSRTAIWKYMKKWNIPLQSDK